MNSDELGAYPLLREPILTNNGYTQQCMAEQSETSLNFLPARSVGSSEVLS